jgi:hypothetical protein
MHGIGKLAAGVSAVGMALGSRHVDLDLSPTQIKTLSSPWCRVLALVLMAFAATGQPWLSLAIGMFIYAFIYHFFHERSPHYYKKKALAAKKASAGNRRPAYAYAQSL